jgi:hypothetical protein
MSARDLVRSRSLRLLDYLTALATERRGAPHRRLADYLPEPVGPADVPAHPQVRLGPAAGRGAWLAIGRTAPPRPPAWPAVLDGLLGGATGVNPDTPPTMPPVLPAQVPPSDPRRRPRRGGRPSRRRPRHPSATAGCRAATA